MGEHMATASKSFEGDADRVGDRPRKEDKKIDQATIELHNASVVVNRVTRDYVHVRPARFDNPQVIEEFDRELGKVQALLNDNYSLSDLALVKGDVRLFSKALGDEIASAPSPTAALKEAERFESSKLVEIASNEGMGLLVELNEILGKLNERSRLSGQREYARPDTTFEMAEKRAAEIMKELAGGGLKELHDKILEVYGEREKLELTKEAKRELAAGTPAQDVANNVRNYAVEALHIGKYKLEEGSNEWVPVESGSFESASKPSGTAEPAQAQAVTTTRTRYTPPRSKSTNYEVGMLAYIKDNKFVSGALDDAQLNALNGAAASGVALSESERAKIYSAVAKAWLEKAAAPGVREFVLKSGISLDATDEKSMEVLSNRLWLVYGRSFGINQLEAAAPRKKVPSRVIALLELDDADFLDEANFIGKRVAWMSLRTIAARINEPPKLTAEDLQGQRVQAQAPAPASSLVRIEPPPAPV